MMRTLSAGRLRRRAAAVTVAALAATGILVGSQATAQAATISVPFLCEFNAPALNATYDLGISSYSVTMTSPLIVDAGDPIAADYTFSPVNTGLPFSIAGAQVRAEPTVNIRTQGGPVLFNVTNTSAPASAASTIGPNGAVTAPSPVSLTVPTSIPSGPVTFVPGEKIEMVPAQFKYVFVAVSDPTLAGANITCTPQTSTAYATRTTIFGPPPLTPVDRCIAQTGDVTGPPGCATQQVVNLSIAQGRLTQRAYTNTTPTVGSIDGGSITAPIGGTSNVNPNPTTVNLGSITSPFAPTTIIGNLNDITVSDTRGGTFGWSLTASMTNFTGVASSTLPNSAMTATPTCSAATVGDAWDYDAPGQSVIPGFDPSLVAPGQAAGSAAQSFGGTVSLCTKNTDENLISGSSGGVYTVKSTLNLTIPSFQAADKYTAIMTITLV
jgi:hypothetical protein